MAMPRLTERVVNRAKARKTKYEISCSVLTGFTLRVLPSGKKVYYVRFRDGAGKDVRERLGPTTELTYAEALTLATAKLSGAQQAPPAPTSSALPSASPRAEAPQAPDSPLFEEFAERFQREHAGVHLKPRTQRTYRQFLATRIIPAFRGVRLAELTFPEVARFHASMADKPYGANACLLIVSSMYTRAIQWGVLGKDFTPPTRGVKKFRTRSRERFLTPAERARLDRFLEAALTRKGYGRIAFHAVAAIRLLSMTGMRRDEILDLTWEMVDFRHKCFRLPDSKTGQKVVPVSDRALDLVRECREVWKSCTFEPKPRHVIYSKNGKRIWSSSLTKTWTDKIRDRLPGFAGVRLHDLRHSMASDAIMAGVPLAVVGKILGHRKAETTARYAHIADSVLSEAVQTVSEAMHHSTKTGKRRKSG
jgi:integrase